MPVAGFIRGPTISQGSTSMRKFQPLCALLALLIAASCSSSGQGARSPQDSSVDAEGGQATILAGDRPSFDTARSLINESFATLLGSIEPGGMAGTVVSVRVEQVLSDLTPYVDTMSVTAPRPGEVVNVKFSDREHLPPAKSGRLLVFVTYGQGQWSVVDQQNGAYLIDDVLEGFPGSTLDGHDAKSTIDDIRVQGDAQEHVLAVARSEESSLNKLRESLLTEVLRLPQIDLQTTPPAPEQNAHALVRSGTKLQTLWCRQSPLTTASLRVGELCVDVPPDGAVELADGSVASVVPVPGRPPTQTMKSAVDTCGPNECFLLFVDEQVSAHAVVPVAAVPYAGPDGLPSKPVALPTESLPRTEQLDVKVTVLGKTDAGDTALFVILTDDTTSAAYGTWCSGPVDTVDACNPNKAQQLLPITKSVFANLLHVPDSCIDGCRVMVVDAADLSRRGSVRL